MKFEDLNDGNIILYAMKYYDNPQCNDEVEFYEDMKRITYIKRLFNRYRLSGGLKVRLILNHLITFTNVFPVEHAVRILFFKIDHKYYHVLKAFLLYLSMMPDKIFGVNGENIISSNIFMDDKVISEIRNFDVSN